MTAATEMACIRCNENDRGSGSAVCAPCQKDIDRAQALAESLRQLADYLETNPSVRIDYGWSDEPSVTLEYYATSAEDFARAVKALGRGDKVTDEYRYRVVRKFGDEASIEVSTRRDAVCKKRVVASEMVTEKVPDYEAAPTKTVTRLKEEVEWDCPPSILGLVDTTQ